MQEYCVKIPIAGYAVIVVEAESPEDARRIALDSDVTLDDIEQWEALEHIAKGNVLYAMQNDMEIE